MMDLIQDLNWRYATKSYTNKIVSDEKINFILEAINLTASSCGLQPYRIYSISNKELQEKLGNNSFNEQISTSSHLLVFAAYNKVTTEHVKDMINLMASERNISNDSLKGLFDMMDSYFKSKSDEENRNWADKQAYIALGTALIAAANQRLDSTPMEGFDSKNFDNILELDKQDLHTSVILSVGYRDEEKDYLSKTKKVRISIDEMVKKVD
ncbi:nitroreductase family protein [Chishuiella sp.]|uniref:nitroreductase family protein n=1 Tax=Chishuiella sp. TaxID=1969467 RepID=UPI0028AEE9AA|nr:nitroreductase family protein [Chishuiella sp.]